MRSLLANTPAIPPERLHATALKLRDAATVAPIDKLRVMLIA